MIATAQTQFAKLGFDYTRFRFGTRTALAACLSLIVAWALGLEHPQWSAMTVWAVSQPTRGLLLEKAAYRALGTLVGTVMGMLLVTIAGDNILALAIGLTLWVGICVYVGYLLHGLISYGAILAGYSASMVALLTRTPDALLPLGIDRLLTVFVGVITALLIGWLFTYNKAERSLYNQFRRQTADNLRLLANAYQQGAITALNIHDRLSQLAHLEAQLHDHGSGSMAAHNSAKTIRRVLNAQLGLFAQLETHGVIQSEKISKHLLTCSEALVSNESKQILDSMDNALADFEHPTLLPYFTEFVEASHDRITFRDTGVETQNSRAVTPPLHRDWQGAKHASLRAVMVMLIISGAWAYTELYQFAYLLLGASVMLTLFSTAENPAKTMYYVFIGQSAGALTAITIQALVWPHMDSIFAMLLCLMPVILIAGLPMSHNKTAPGAMDFNLVFLLLMQPSLDYHFDLMFSTSLAIAVVAAPLISIASYRIIFPTDIRSRLEHLVLALEHDIQRLQQRTISSTQLQRYRARLYHRLFKLYQLTDKLTTNDKVYAGQYVVKVQHQLNQHE